MAEGSISGPFLTTKSIRLPVLSLKLGKMFQAGNESIDVRIEDHPQVVTDLFIYSYGFRMRQGWSRNNGTTKFYWTFHIDYRQIAVCSYYRGRETATWSWEITWQNHIHGVREVAFTIDDDDNNDLPEPSEWPLAKAVLSPNAIVTLELDISRAERFMPQIGHLLVNCGRLEIPPLERQYLQDTTRAIEAEAASEMRVLQSQGCTVRTFIFNNRVLLAIWPSEDRPFRLYRGCTIILRGRVHFLRQKARRFPCRMLRGEPQDWFATVLSPAPRWRDMVAAPIHAALWNEIDVDARPLPLIIGAIEEQVEVLPLINPTVKDQMLAASKSLSTYIANDGFDNMCRELEGTAPVSEMSRSTLPLRALFCPGQPRISTEAWLPGFQNIDINALIPSSWSLNDSQKLAVGQLLQYKFSLVVGPPGTGKTQVIAAAALFLTQVVRRRELAKIAVLVPTHNAGDAVVEKLVNFVAAHPELKNRFLRVRSFNDTSGRLFAGVSSPNDDQGKMERFFRESAGRYFAHFWRGTREITESGRILDRNLLARYHIDRKELLKEIMGMTDIVITTVMNVRELEKRNFRPNGIIFDEASFFRDPEIFHALSVLSSTNRVLMVGDYKQLCPPVFTEEGQRVWATSAFERLHTAGYPSVMLDIQYRSHARLYAPTSEIFYDAQVRSAHVICSMSVNRLFDGAVTVRWRNSTWHLPREIGFLNYAGQTSRDASKSILNHGEAEIAIRLARVLMQHCRNVLIISPYKAQVGLTAQKWEETYPGMETKPRIQTVDGVQGAEGDVVIVMLTKNSAYPGFLASSRRINVMTSRAKHCVYFIGNWDWVSGQVIREHAPQLQAVMVHYRDTIDMFLCTEERN